MLNDLPWKWTKIILSFLRLQPRYCILDSFVDHDGYSISSLGFFPTVVDIMVIWIKLALPIHFSSLIPRMLMFILTTSCLTISNFTLIHGPNIPVSYAILFFAASDFTFITRHIHKWSTFLLWPSCLILPGTISGSPLLFPTSILDTFQPGGIIFWCRIFLSFYTVHEVLTASILGCLLFPPPVDHVLSELSSMTRLSCVALHGMVHSFIELCKLLWRKWSGKGDTRYRGWQNFTKSPGQPEESHHKVDRKQYHRLLSPLVIVLSKESLTIKLHSEPLPATMALDSTSLPSGSPLPSLCFALPLFPLKKSPNLLEKKKTLWRAV